jgi:hypothetical protein
MLFAGLVRCSAPRFEQRLILGLGVLKGDIGLLGLLVALREHLLFTFRHFALVILLCLRILSHMGMV